MYSVLANGIRYRGFNKGRSSMFRVGSRVRQTPEEVRRAYRPKRCESKNKEGNCPKTLNDKNLRKKSTVSNFQSDVEKANVDAAFKSRQDAKPLLKHFGKISRLAFCRHLWKSLGFPERRKKKEDWFGNSRTFGKNKPNLYVNFVQPSFSEKKAVLCFGRRNLQRKFW